MTVKNRLMISLLYGPFSKKWKRCNTWNVCFFSAILCLILNSYTLNWMGIHMQLNVEPNNLFFHLVNIFVYYNHGYIVRRVHTAKCINEYITGKKINTNMWWETWNEPFSIVLSPRCLLFHSPYLYVFTWNVYFCANILQFSQWWIMLRWRKYGKSAELCFEILTFGEFLVRFKCTNSLAL